MDSLESFLFGDKGEAVRDLGREEALANEAALAASTAATTATTAAHRSIAEPLLFFEDRNGGKAAANGDGCDDGASAAAAAARVTRRSAAAAAAKGADATPPPTQTAAVVSALPRSSSAAAPSPAAPSSSTAAAWSDPYVETAVVDLASGAARWRKLRQDDEGERRKVPVGGGEFERRLRRRVQHSSGSRARAWASRAKAEAAKRGLKDARDEDDDGPSTPDVLTSGASLLAGASSASASAAAATAAGSARLEVSRLLDANAADASDAVVSAVDFHDSGQLLLTAGMDKRLRFFQADGARNSKLQSLFLRDMPIRQAAFCGASGNLALAVGRRPFLYVFDLGSGRAEKVQKPLGREERTFEAFAVSKSGGGGGDVVALLGNRGCIPLLSLKSRCLAGELRTAGGTVRSAAFDPSDGNVLVATGGDGVVHSWDLRTRRCLGRSSDEGAVSGTALACGGGWIAAGSDSGVVNVYGRGRGGTLLSSSDGGLKAGRALVGGDDGGNDGGGGSSLFRSPASAARPKPARSLLNLTTTIDTLAFSPGGELLVLASRMRRDALRVCSGADLKVYANWPSSRTPLGHVHCAAFSPGGGMLAIGNAKGKCLLYRINHLPVV